ncbi:MAG: SixA phosphatase family protein [Bacteroidota bacterium]
MKSYKQLFIVRHGKSSWEYEHVDDIDRPLKIKGINDAYAMAKRLDSKNKKPQLIISSPANRALHTSIIFSRVLDYPLFNLRLNEIIYNGDEDDILNLIHETDDSISTLMIFGHNPVSTDLSNMFLKDKLDKLPTAGITSLNFKADSWKDISKDNVSTELVDYPKKPEK